LEVSDTADWNRNGLSGSGTAHGGREKKEGLYWQDEELKTQTKTIAVGPNSALISRSVLFEVLRTLFPVQFVPWSGAAASCDAVLLFGPQQGEAAKLVEGGVSVCVVDEPQVGTAAAGSEIRFVGAPKVQPHLRDQTFKIQSPERIGSLVSQPGDTVIATSGGQPVWLERTHDQARLVAVAFELPAMESGKPLFPSLLRGGWIRILPLFHFLREVTRDLDWEGPGPRACFMFDDPNLHWTHWGFIKYFELLEHAKAHRYHVSMATVPVDMWYTQSRAAELFKRNSEYLSLLIHGFNHTALELLRPMPSDRRLRELGRGLEIVRRLEERHGVKVSKVMAPPHHACSVESSNVMLRLGYEGVCVSFNALMRRNPQLPWPPAFGLAQAEFLGGGFPLIPRFNFADEDSSHVYLADFFHQPIIPVGHHYDVAGGLDVLAGWAKRINGLGAVRWSDLQTIARSNYLTRRHGKTLHVKMGSRRIDLPVPAGVERLVVERPWLAITQCEELCLAGDGSECEARLSASGQTEALPVPAGSSVEISALPAERISAKELAPARAGAWPLLRRLLCESRDRLMPCRMRLKRAAGL
jgi:hypothetical protein